MPIFECSRCNELTYSAARESREPCPRCGEERQRVLDGAFADVETIARAPAPGDHAALVYRAPELVAPFCARFLTEGIDRSERVMAVVPDDLKRALEPLLAADVKVLIEWQDPYAIYGHFDADPVASMYDTLIGAEERRVRVLAVVAEEYACDATPAEVDRYEKLAHDIVNRHGATALCAYDERGLDPGYLKVARQRHPLALRDGALRRNPGFEYEPA